MSPSDVEDALQTQKTHAAHPDSREAFLAFSRALRQFAVQGGAPPLAAAPGVSGVASVLDPAAVRAPSPPLAAAAPPADDAAAWLYDACARVPSPLPPLQLASAVLAALHGAPGSDESQLQSSLSELFGEGEASIAALFEVMGRADDLRSVIGADLAAAAARRGDGAAAASAAALATGASADEARLVRLRAEAYEAADRASALRLHQAAPEYAASRGTHSVARKSDREAEKAQKKAQKQAQTAVARAREAGALTESDDLFLRDQLAVTGSRGGDPGSERARRERAVRDEEFARAAAARGLDGMTPAQIHAMTQGLAPAGTREYSDANERGLPRGTTREVREGYEEVVIPAPVRDRALLRERVDLDEALGADTAARQAFLGTASLNPMQSTVYPAAYGTRENLVRLHRVRSARRPDEDSGSSCNVPLGSSSSRVIALVVMSRIHLRNSHSFSLPSSSPFLKLVRHALLAIRPDLALSSTMGRSGRRGH